VLQCFVVSCSVLQCVVVCCSVLQYVAMCCSVLQCDKCVMFTLPSPSSISPNTWCVCCSMLHCVEVCCSVSCSLSRLLPRSHLVYGVFVCTGGGEGKEERWRVVYLWEREGEREEEREEVGAGE